MTEFLDWAVIGAGAVAVLVTIPALLELLLVTIGAFRKRADSATVARHGFRLAAVVPAHNEKVLIGDCVASILRSARAGASCDVVVVADNCTDDTAARARTAGARVLVREDSQRRGKGFALRFAFDQLMDEGFDGFLIVDADSVVSTNLVREIVSSLSSGADAVQARYRVAGPLDSLRKRLMDVALLAFNVLRPRGRHGWGISAGITGNGFALSRQTLRDVPYSADSIVEDLEYHLLLVSEGKKVRFADRATVYGAMPDDRAAQSSQRARWEGGRLRVAREWLPKLVKQLGHGRVAALEPALELLTLPLAYLAVVAFLLCVLPYPFFRWYGAAVLGTLFIHVLSALAVGETFLSSFLSLVAAPFYVIWKMTTLLAVFRSSGRKTEWVRTQRKTGAI
jgi:cellulose synthase/poly-beta-1,6-N-acetylglucosamine synthase-like glycosyltransferase